MPDSATPNAHSTPNRRRRVQAAIGVAVFALVIAAGWYLSSPRFNEYVRTRVIAQLEDATGGRVEMRSLRWNLSRLSFEVDDLTIHGLEAPNEVPYAHVDHLIARAKIVSFWQRDIGFHFLELQHPVIHLIAYADGTTNQPRPKVRSQRDKSAPEYVFDLAIERAEVHDGVFILNDRAQPFDFSGSGLRTVMTYSQPDRRYDGSIHADKLDAKFKDMRPVSAIMDGEFSVFAKRAQIKSLKISTGRSQLTATGTIEDFAKPKLTFTYVGNVNLGEFGGFARIAQLRAGGADIKGQGEYAASHFKINGVLGLKQVEYVDGSLQLRNFAATTNYRADDANLVLDKIVARAFGGDVTGSAGVHNWLSGPSTLGNAQQQGTAAFRLAGLSVAELVQSISTRDLPIDKMNPVGQASGDASLSWKGALTNASAELAINIAPPAQTSPGELPITAHAKGSLAAGGNRLEVAELSLATPATRITASGTLGARNSNVKLSVSTHDMGEFKPLLATLKPNQMPVDVHGSASFDGTISGTVRSPNVAGHLEIRDFDSVLMAAAAPATSVTPLRKAAASPQTATTQQTPSQATTSRIHWDAFTADVQYSPTQASVRNGVLRRGSAQLNFDGSSALTSGQFTETSPLSARVNLRDGDITDLQSLLGFTYPVTGTMNLTANIDGTQSDPHGEGRVIITNATVRGETVKALTSDIRFASHEAQLTNIDLAHNGSHITGTAAYNLTSKTFRFDLKSPGIDLATIHELRTRIPVSGRLEFTAQGSGTVEQPVINAHARVSNMFNGAERLGDITADAVTTGDTMKITGRSNFQNSDVRLDGSVGLRGDFPAQLTLQAQQVDIDPLLRAYIKGQITVPSRVAGKIEARGPLRDPRLLTVTGVIQQLSAEVEHVGVRNDGPIEFAMENQVVTIRRMRLVGEGTELTGTGTVQLAGDRHIDIHADGQVNMRLLQTFNPDFRSEGMVNVNARVAGTVAQPAIFGTLKVSNGAISYIDLPNGLSDINGTLAFNQDRLQIQQLTARTGGGTLNLGGFITYGRNVTFNITANAKDMRLRYPPGVSSQADADLRLTGTLKASLLSGDITVTKFGVNPRFDFALYLAKAKQAPPTPNPDSLLNNLRLDVHITSTPELQVQTSLARISGNADLRVRGTGTRPSLLGRVSIIEGDVFFNGTKYHLEHGDITFTNPVRVEPVMDMEATTTVRNYDITLGFHGRMEALSVTYRSDPPLSSADIIQLLAFGRTQEEAAQQSTLQSNFTESASNAILSQALNAAVSSRVQKLFGVTRVKVDPRIGGAENNPSGARVTVEQQVANNLTLTYITDLTRSTQQVIQVEYNINHNLSLTAVRDQNGVVGVDIRFRQRKR